MILDEVKLSSDDASFTEQHVIFLANNYRNYIIRLQKEKKLTISESNSQTVCIDLEPTEGFEGLDACNEYYLRSVQEIPQLMDEGAADISLMDYFSGTNLSYVTKQRFRHVGFNRYLRNIIYCTLADDDHLYVRSNNEQFKYLEKLKLTGVFEDAAAAAELSCDEKGNECDILDTRFPLDASFIPQLIEACVKELLGAAYRPADAANNANDDLSDMMSFIRRNMKSNLAKQIEE